MATEPLKRLSPRHHAAITRMAQGGFVNDIADELGIPVATLYAWRKDPLFRAALDEVTRGARDEGLEQIRSATLTAVAYLLRACGPEAKITTPGVKAACELLNRAGLLAATDPDEGGLDVTDQASVMALLRALPASLLIEALKTPAAG